MRLERCVVAPDRALIVTDSVSQHTSAPQPCRRVRPQRPQGRCRPARESARPWTLSTARVRTAESSGMPRRRSRRGRSDTPRSALQRPLQRPGARSSVIDAAATRRLAPLASCCRLPLAPTPPLVRRLHIIDCSPGCSCPPHVRFRLRRHLSRCVLEPAVFQAQPLKSPHHPSPPPPAAGTPTGSPHASQASTSMAEPSDQEAVATCAILVRPSACGRPSAAWRGVGSCPAAACTHQLADCAAAVSRQPAPGQKTMVPLLPCGTTTARCPPSTR